MLALAGCLRLAVFQGVHVYPTPDVASEAFCHELHVSAEFGVHSLVDTTFTVGDADVFFFETPSAPTQPHYNGMPLAIDVECTNSSGAIVGHSEYLGRLQNSNDSAVVAVYNYSLQDDCIGPLQGTGVQVCLAGYGYDWD